MWTSAIASEMESMACASHRDGGLVERLQRDQINDLRIVASRNCLLDRLLNDVAAMRNPKGQVQRPGTMLDGGCSVVAYRMRE